MVACMSPSPESYRVARVGGSCDTRSVVGRPAPGVQADPEVPLLAPGTWPARVAQLHRAGAKYARPRVEKPPLSGAPPTPPRALHSVPSEPLRPPTHWPGRDGPSPHTRGTGQAPMIRQT